MSAPVNIIRNGSQDITDYVNQQKMDCILVLTKEVGTCTFYMFQTPESAASIPVIGDTIVVNDPSTGSNAPNGQPLGPLFGGVVTEIEQTVNSGAGILIEYEITVTDYEFTLDSKLVKGSYVNMDPADIVAALVSTYGPGGFDYTTYVQRGGFLVSTISFNYVQLTKAIQQLATQIGWDWNVDAEKNVHFFFATTQDGSSEYNPAPFNIDDTGANIIWPSIDIDVSITNMKNAVYVLGGKFAKNLVLDPVPGALPPQYDPVDVYTTDGVKSVFPLAYHYEQSTMVVTLNGTGQSIGTDQQTDPATVEVLYNDSGPFLRFTTVPTSGQTLIVQGYAEIPILAYVENLASIAEFGLLEDSIVDTTITSVQEAQERAQADITLYGHPVYDVKFNTTVPGLRIGQIIFLNSAKFGTTNYPLVIKRIEAVSFGWDKLKYQVEAFGSDTVTFTDMQVLLLSKQLAAAPVAPGTVLQILLYLNETVDVDDDVTIIATSAPYVWAPPTQFPSIPQGAGMVASFGYGSVAYGAGIPYADETPIGVASPEIVWNFFAWS